MKRRWWDRRLGRWFLRLDLTEMHRPRPIWWWGEGSRAGQLTIGIAWGSRLGDPVWSVELDVTPPPRLAVWLPRWERSA